MAELNDECHCEEQWIKRKAPKERERGREMWRRGKPRGDWRHWATFSALLKTRKWHRVVQKMEPDSEVHGGAVA